MTSGKTIRLFALSLIFLLPATAGFAAKLEKMPFSKEGPGELHCTVTVMFSSVADGIDNNSLAEVEHYVESNPAITGSRLYSMGMEGETTICIMTSPDKSQAVFDAIKDIMPPKPTHGGISLMMGDQKHSVP